MKLELSASECLTMIELLESTLSDLSVEIADTDTFDYREGLKSKRAELINIMERLKVASA